MNDKHLQLQCLQRERAVPLTLCPIENDTLAELANWRIGGHLWLPFNVQSHAHSNYRGSS